MKDAFISYAHLDNRPDEPGQRGWVERFHYTLKVRLDQLRGQESEVWRDPQLEGNQVFERTLEREMREVKALISIITPRYLKSESCRREVLDFHAAAPATGGLALGDRTRLFKVLKTPVPPEDLPKDLPPPLVEMHTKLLGYQFFDFDPQNKRPREYNPDLGAQAKELYYAKINDLAWELSRLLAEYDRNPPRPPTTDGAPKTVYLAEGTSDLESARDRVKRELLDRGHVVLPDRHLPWVAAEVRSVVKASLERSDLALHPIGSFYGVIPEGATESLAVIQHDLAAELARTTSLPRILWMPPQTAPAEPRQTAFIQFLREQAAGEKRVDLLEGTLDQLKELVRERLRPPPPPPPEDARRVEPSAVAAAPVVYLIGDPSDQRIVETLDQFLFDGGAEVTRCHHEGSASDLAAAHQRRLQTCDAALICYGSTSRDWVDMKLMDLQQARGYGREKAFRACAVCIAPPTGGGKESFRSRLAEVIRLGDPLDPKPLSSFLEQIVAHP